MKTCALTPLDAWFFRDGRPYNEKEANQADVASVFPPPARTLSGALRAALARANGWTGRGSWPDPLNRAFGSGSEELGSLQFTGPFLILNGEALWPLPRHVLGSVSESWEPRAFLRPAEAAMACDAGNLRLPEIVISKGTRCDTLKTAETAWVTAAGLGTLLAGELPEAHSIVLAKMLWVHEARIGLHRDEKKLITEEGALYSPSYVRLRRGVALGVSVAGVPEGMAHVGDILPLGGESRLARCEEWGRTTRDDVDHVRRIPRPRGRGPVEASLPRPVRAALSAFRARAGAAPLKRGVPCQKGPGTGVHSAPARARPR